MIFENLQGKGPGYLNRSYCRLIRKGEDLGVCYVVADMGVVVATNNTKEFVIRKDVQDYEFLTPKLGNVYIPEVFSAYVRRIPSRNWRVGLTTNNITHEILLHHRKDQIITSLNRVERNEYPSFQEALRRGKKEYTPFSLRYAVFDNCLYYMGERLGVINNTRVKVTTDYAAGFHDRVIGSLTGLTFWAEDYRQIDYEGEDV